MAFQGPGQVRCIEPETRFAFTFIVLNDEDGQRRPKEDEMTRVD